MEVVCHRYTYSMVQSPSKKLTGLQLIKKFPPFLWNPKVHYRTHKRPPPVLSWASPIQSTYPHPTSWRSILILSTHLRLGLPSGLFPSGFPTKTLYAPLLLTHMRHMPSPSHSSRFYNPHNIVIDRLFIMFSEFDSLSSQLFGCNSIILMMLMKLFSIF